MGALAVLAALAVGAAVLVVLFVTSIGTATVTVQVEALVLDRETRAPVPGCLLAFEQGTPGVYPRTTERTDSRGRVAARTTYSYVGSPFLSFRREREPELRFHLGEPPRYGTYETVETWRVRLSFREPWTKGREVVPRVEVERGLFHEEVLMPPEGRKWQQAGVDALPKEPADRLVGAVVRFEDHPDGRTSYRVELKVLLDANQIAACRAAGRPEAEAAAADPADSRR